MWKSSPMSQFSLKPSGSPSRPDHHIFQPLQIYDVLSLLQVVCTGGKIVPQQLPWFRCCKRGVGTWPRIKRLMTPCPHTSRNRTTAYTQWLQYTFGNNTIDPFWACSLSASDLSPKEKTALCGVELRAVLISINVVYSMCNCSRFFSVGQFSSIMVFSALPITAVIKSFRHRRVGNVNPQIPSTHPPNHQIMGSWRRKSKWRKT